MLAARALPALIQLQEPLQQPIFGLHHSRHLHTCRDLRFTCFGQQRALLNLSPLVHFLPALLPFSPVGLG